MSSKVFERWLISRIDIPAPGSARKCRCASSSTGSARTEGPARNEDAVGRAGGFVFRGSAMVSLLRWEARDLEDVLRAAWMSATTPSEVPGSGVSARRLPSRRRDDVSVSYVDPAALIRSNTSASTPTRS